MPTRTLPFDGTFDQLATLVSLIDANGLWYGGTGDVVLTTDDGVELTWRSESRTVAITGAIAADVERVKGRLKRLMKRFGFAHDSNIDPRVRGLLLMEAATLPNRHLDSSGTPSGVDDASTGAPPHSTKI